MAMETILPRGREIFERNAGKFCLEVDAECFKRVREEVKKKEGKRLVFILVGNFFD